MDQILIIRLTDSDGTIYQTIIDALKDYSIHSVCATSTNVLAFGDIEIYPEQRCC